MCGEFSVSFMSNVTTCCMSCGKCLEDTSVWFSHAPSYNPGKILYHFYVIFIPHYQARNGTKVSSELPEVKKKGRLPKTLK